MICGCRSHSEPLRAVGCYRVTASSSGLKAGQTTSLGQAKGLRPASSNVPTWLLCPPAGASGNEPLLTGTKLSCAPRQRGAGSREATPETRLGGGGQGASDVHWVAQG